MPVVVQFSASDALFAKVATNCQWFYDRSSDRGGGPDVAGLSFGASSNRPLVFSGARSTATGPGVDYTIPYMDLSLISPISVTANIGADASFTFASWDHTIVSGTLYGTNADGQVTYPGDLLYDQGPYTHTIGDLEFSDPTDQTAWNNAFGTQRGPCPVYGGFMCFPTYPGFTAQGNGPTIFFVDPEWKTYRRLTFIGAANDFNALNWCNLFASMATGGDTPIISPMYDGTSYWFGLASVLTSFDPGPFPVLQVSPAINPGGYFPYPIVAPNSIRIRVSGGRAIGPTILGTCCMTDDSGQLSSLPIFPTASGIR